MTTFKAEWPPLDLQGWGTGTSALLAPKCLGSGVGMGGLPSGGPCAAVSALLPAGTPCLSDPGVAPHWKDRGQGQATLTPEVLGHPFPAGILTGPGGVSLGEARSQLSSWPCSTQ